MIRGGKISVNKRIVRSPELWVDPRRDFIEVEGRSLKKAAFIYLAIHKPAGFVTTHSDELGRKTVYDLLPKAIPWVFPIGRLDKESSGLLLLTNDTRFGEKVSSPMEKVPKTYAVLVDRPLSDSDRKVMESGLTLADGTRLKPAVVRISKSDHAFCKITLHEGKNRQIRRMFETLGYNVLDLNRVSIGAIHLGNLKEGEMRMLSSEERASIIGTRA
jgi:pseudouridine synthase